MVDRQQRPDVPLENPNDTLHRRQLAMRANAALSKDGTNGMTAPLKLVEYTTAELPDATLWKGALVYSTTYDAVFYSNGTSWIKVSPIKLTADGTFVVVAATGNDLTGDGTIGNPFATPQGAYDYCLHNVDANGFFVKIRMNDSSSTTYTATTKRRTTDEFSTDHTVLTINANIQNCPCVEFEGAGLTGPDYSTNRIKWNADGGECVFIAAVAGLYRFQGIKFVDNAGTSSVLFFAFNECTIGIQDSDFGSHVTDYHIHIGNGTVLKLFGDYSISAGAGLAHIFAEQCASIDHEGPATITITGTPAFGTSTTGGFLWVTSNSEYAIVNPPGNAVTYSGSATGIRYRIENSSIATSSAAELNDFLPGNATGISTYDFNGTSKTVTRRIENLASGATGATAWAASGFTGGDYGTLVQIQNLGTNACGLFWTDAGHAVTKIAGDASFQASTTPGGGNSGFGWSGSAYQVYNNTGLTRSYSILAHVVVK